MADCSSLWQSVKHQTWDNDLETLQVCVTLCTEGKFLRFPGDQITLCWVSRVFSKMQLQNSQTVKTSVTYQQPLAPFGSQLLPDSPHRVWSEGGAQTIVGWGLLKMKIPRPEGNILQSPFSQTPRRLFCMLKWRSTVILETIWQFIHPSVQHFPEQYSLQALSLALSSQRRHCSYPPGAQNLLEDRQTSDDIVECDHSFISLNDSTNNYQEPTMFQA